MNRAVVGITLALFSIPGLLQGQAPAGPRAASPAFVPLDFDPDLMGGAADPMGGGGAGQAEYSAMRGESFSRLAFRAAVSTLGIGAELGSNLGPRMDVRLFGNYTNLTHNYTQSGFHVSLNLAMANTGAKVDFYPLRRIPLRISPGFLYFNRNRIGANLRAQPGATFTINNVQYASDSAHPVYGTGRLLLGGTGFMATTGLGHIVSHSYKRWSVPFEAGVVFINTPVAQFNLFGVVCNESPAHQICRPAAQLPTFATNLRAQVVSWNRTVAPYHIYPILEGGFAYSFNLRRRGVE